MSELDYDLRCLAESTGERELAAMRAQAATLPERPRISLAIALGDLDEYWAREGIRSVRRQCYPDWQLCVATCGGRSRLDDVLTNLGDDERVTRAEASDDRVGAVAKALAAADGEYVALLDEGDELSPDALFRCVELILETGADVVYTDEDAIDAAGSRRAPSAKPPWSADVLLLRPYLGRLCLLRRELVTAVGGLDPRLGAEAEHDLLLRATERARRVEHLPRVLYHRRSIPDPRGAEARPEASASTAAAEAALRRRGDGASVGADAGGAVRLAAPSGPARISLVLTATRPSRRFELLEALVRTGSQPYEVLLAGVPPVETRGCEAIAHPHPVVAANRAAARARGDVLVFAEGRAEVAPGVAGDWPARIAAHALRPGVGAVSGRVGDGNGRPRFAGATGVLDGLLGPLAGHSAPTAQAEEVANPGAATASLLAIRRSTFEALGGFESERLRGAAHGLDLAFRLEEEGARSVYAPEVRLNCFEPQTTPSDPELRYMWERWGRRLSELADRSDQLGAPAIATSAVAR